MLSFYLSFLRKNSQAGNYSFWLAETFWQKAEQKESLNLAQLFFLFFKHFPKSKFFSDHKLSGFAISWALSE
jgi:hypothetical protein